MRNAHRRCSRQIPRGRGQTSARCGHGERRKIGVWRRWWGEIVPRETFLVIRDAISRRSGQPRMTLWNRSYLLHQVS